MDNIKPLNIAIVGATGQVGMVVLSILEERNFKLNNLRLFASKKSKGSKIAFRDKDYFVEDVAEQTTETLKGIDVAIFSAGGKVSKQYAPIFAEAKVVVIDNSSAWRKDPEIPLVVSEVNPEDIDIALKPDSKKIIANPNCTTMAAMPVIKPLHDKKILRKLVISTYQCVSGMGVAGGVELLEMTEHALEKDPLNLITNGEAVDFPEPQKFPAPISFNVLPYAGNLVDDGTLETDEEQKLRNESRKILHLPKLRVEGTCVRVPVFTGHSLSVVAEFTENITPTEAVSILKDAPGVSVVGTANPTEVASSLKSLSGSGVEVLGEGAKAGLDVAGLATPLMAAGKDDSIVGRIRQDYSLENADPTILEEGQSLNQRGLTFFICSDNLRKGAALNTVQIAEIIQKKLS